MDREAWQATVQVVTKSQTQLSKYTTTILTHPFIHSLTSLSKVHEFKSVFKEQTGKIFVPFLLYDC